MLVSGYKPGGDLLHVKNKVSSTAALHALQQSEWDDFGSAGILEYPGSIMACSSHDSSMCKRWEWLGGARTEAAAVLKRCFELSLLRLSWEVTAMAEKTEIVSDRTLGGNTIRATLHKASRDTVNLCQVAEPFIHLLAQHEFATSSKYSKTNAAETEWLGISGVKKQATKRQLP